MRNAQRDRRPSLTVEALESRLVPDASAYIQGLYHDVLHRSQDASPQEVSAWVSHLQVVGTAQVAHEFNNSHEHHQRQVDDAYVEILHRGADDAGREGWASQLDAGASLTNIRLAIYLSPEYQNGHATDDRFVRGLYQDVLGRSPGAAEVANWQSLLTSGLSRARSAQLFLNSPEELGQQVHAMYTEILHRNESQAERDAWVSAIRGGRATELIREDFMHSGEYEAEHGFIEVEPNHTGGHP